MAQTTKTRGSRSVASKALAIIGAGLALVSITAPIASAAPVEGGSQVREETEVVLSPRVCDTTTILGEDIPDVREDMEVERVDAPSQSPSLSMPCSDSYSNIRGSYTSTMAPCVVTFHSEEVVLVNGGSPKEMQEEGDSEIRDISEGNRDGDSEEAKSPLYYQGTSSVCGIDNAIGEAKEYVSSWPDECVGDFARCYNLKDPRYPLCEDLNRLLRRLDSGSELSGVPFLPPGTTHVSVDCTIDRQTLIESYERLEHLEHVKIRESVSADKERTLFTVAMVLLAVLIVLLAISHLVVQPIVGAIGEARVRHHRNDAEGNQFSSLVANDTGGFQLETDDRESSPPTEANPTIHEILPLDETETAAVLSPQHQPPIEVEVDMVPIVSATILPLNVIHAEVIHDGIFYEQ
mmetsp:Transcript_17657/g.40720  ORF Transcript_17657/g.40720 Transcript_17657/m.40720 type:complete len:406 (-) Transcript_17657:232-1449(-)|eukprot:CAMPEP_0197179452 /NCGR_PEP_ID=MMETSP1423-20130617/4393_1 /TAXON_ID=476441 /ORGANISM="Pseudo-nitzschia heimii, Strain UNC1101" /LENGTH=405 /DNA_ID=CAMNT_0042629363 /DNA_START=320 /DNA_END=1537 /DNA_ORIENTATION=-